MTRSEVRQFAKEARALGVQYIGLCCGNSSNMVREVAVEYGRTPPAAQYAPDMKNCTLASGANPHIEKRQFYGYARTFDIQK